MRVLVVVLGATLASGCATGTGTPRSGTSVNQEARRRDRDALPPATGIPLKEYMATVRHLSARPITKGSTDAHTESLEPRLAAALRAAAAGPSAQTHLRVAHEYLRLGILDTAFTFANLAVRRDPRRAEAHEVLARIWRDWGFPGLGLGAAMRATYFDRTSASAENTLGTLFDALHQPAEARRAFVRALALDPRAGWVLNNLCFVELRVGRLAEARSHCEAALAIDPALSAAANNLALTFVASGDAAAAGRAFLAAGSPANAAYNRGIIHMAKRQYGPAAEAFEAAIAARPEFTAAKARAHEARMLILTFPQY
jgi:Tfp pilus assembly protein PilF